MCLDMLRVNVHISVRKHHSLEKIVARNNSIKFSTCFLLELRQTSRNHNKKLVVLGERSFDTLRLHDSVETRFTL